MSKEIEHCHECGAKKVIYRHHLTKGLLIGLWALYRAGGASKLSDLNLTVSQHNNFQKLRYWQLIDKSDKPAEWKITKLGRDWLAGELRMEKTVSTYRGKIESYSSPAVSARSLDHDFIYHKAPDYIRESENLTKSGHLFPEMV